MPFGDASIDFGVCRRIQTRALSPASSMVSMRPTLMPAILTADFLPRPRHQRSQRLGSPRHLRRHFPDLTQHIDQCHCRQMTTMPTFNGAIESFTTTSLNMTAVRK